MKKRVAGAAVLLAVVLIFGACSKLPTGAAASLAQPESAPEGTPVRGKWSNGVYTSATAGLTFTLRDGYIAMEDAELGPLMLLEAGQLPTQGAVFSDTLRAKWEVTDMVARNDAAAVRVSVVYVRLATGAPAGQQAVEAYLGESGTGANSAPDSAGEVVFAETTLSGHSYLTAVDQSTEHATTHRYFRRLNDAWLVGVIIAAPSEADIAPVLACFN